MKTITFLLVLLPALLIFSCSPPAEQPVTDEEALAFTRQVDSFVSSGDASLFRGLMHEELLARRIQESSDEKLKSEFLEGIKSALDQNMLGRQLSQSIHRSKGSYELVRQYKKDNVQHVIYRLFGEDGLNYHDFELSKYKDKVYAADIFIYLTGEDLSKTLAELGGGFMSMASVNRQNALEKVKDIQELKQLVSNQQFAAAHEKFKHLPANVQHMKAVQLINIQACSQLSEDEYLAALNDYEKLYANEPYMFLVLIDSYFLQKKYDKAVEVLEKVNGLVGGDPVIDYYKALLYKEKGDKGISLHLLEDVYSKKPEFREGLLELIVAYIDAGEFDKARPLVASYQAHPDFNQDVLNMYLAIYPQLSNGAAD